MKKILIISSIIGITLNLNAISTDEYGRDVRGHDRDGGHTMSRHVGKSHTYLRSRCGGRKNSNFYTSYNYETDASASLRVMIWQPTNRARINLFQQNKGQNVRKTLPVKTSIVKTLNHFPSGFGKGINCAKLGEIKIIRIGGWFTWRINLDEYNYLKKATAYLGYNYPKQRWYVQTSFPAR